MDIQNVLKTIETCSEDEVRRIYEASFIKLRSHQQERQIKAAARFSVGDKVSFLPKRRGGWVSGSITKINMKTVHLRTNTGETWHVSPSILVKEIA